MPGIETEAVDIDVLVNVIIKRDVYTFYIKRCFDLVLALIAAIILFPFHLLIVMIIKITMPGPILFNQERLGCGGKTFNILKFRTMRIDKQAIEEYDSTKDAERITRFGNLLRRTKLDESLQVYNVLKGDMSIVGPRPTVMRAMVEDGIDPRRLAVRPGLTGLAQINGNVTLSWPERVEYDIEYIDKMSFWLDCKIILKTVLVVLLGEDKFTRAPHSQNTITIIDSNNKMSG